MSPFRHGFPCFILRARRSGYIFRNAQNGCVIMHLYTSYRRYSSTIEVILYLSMPVDLPISLIRR